MLQWYVKNTAGKPLHGRANKQLAKPMDEIPSPEQVHLPLVGNIEKAGAREVVNGVRQAIREG
jgi:hypothetical protein